MDNRQLLEIMEKCGHFLYHRRGFSRRQTVILNYLIKNENSTQNDIQQIFNLKSATISENVAKLYANGYIEKKRDTADRRKIILSVTEKGRHFWAENTERDKSQLEIMFTALTDEEMSALFTLLTKLLEDWESKFDSELFNHFCERRAAKQ